ncbi:hypothetical protein JAAARDRAFT_44009 [Jaapia argillacea MUCL 33604]|uniref:Uncharacterized protein n=1 Tax=Jaapia argillacea MUCL 33604 TaxID=933084 RepID=A0A067Q9X4_9AGAM|nr:hypothetical protein JAAARDRAFT_44009 [Jaapia argillacea MUCL 33604]
MTLLGLFQKRDKHQKVSKAGSNGSLAAEAPLSRATSTNTEELVDTEYILPSSSTPASHNGNGFYKGPPTASSSKVKLPGFRRQHAAAPLPDSHSNGAPTRVSKSSNFSSADSAETDADLLQVPPDRKSLFTSFGGDRSTRSLPDPRPSNDSHVSMRKVSITSTEASPPPGSTGKKSGGLFGWARRERTKSKAAEPPPPPTIESFNLKSFRHVTPEPPALPTAAALPPPLRPRGNSNASDTSQRISVAAFREAQARRSQAGSPVQSLKPPSTLDLPLISRPSPAITTTPRTQSETKVPTSASAPPSHLRSPPRRATAPAPAVASLSTTSESESEESESDEESPSRAARHRTITRASAKAKSELGHSSPSSNRTITRLSSAKHGQQTLSSGTAASGPSPESTRTPSISGTTISRSSTVYSRKRASVSTSALQPNAAAKRASAVITANSAMAAALASGPPFSSHKRVPAHDSDTDESASGSDSEDDAPLSSLLNPKRPGTAMSHTSTSTSRSAMMKRAPAKPLIDINSLTHGAPPTLPHRDEMQDEKEKEKPKNEKPQEKPKPREKEIFSPTNVSARLATLAKGIGSKSAENLIERGLDSSLSSAARPRPRRETMSPPSSARFSNFDQLSLSPFPSPMLSPKSPESQSVLTSSPTSLSPSPLASPTESATKRIFPTPVRSLSPPPSFTVTSRPQSHHPSPPSAPSVASSSSSINHPPASAPHFHPSTAPRKSSFASASSSASPSPSSNPSAPRQSSYGLGSPPASSAPSNSPAPRKLTNSALSSPAASPPSSNAPVPRKSTSSSASSPSTVSGSGRPTLVSLIPASATGFGNAPIPNKPFAPHPRILRGNSPSSSTGDSSSGRAPYTPRDGSEYGNDRDRDRWDAKSAASAKKSHRKSGSVSFEDELDARGRSGAIARERMEKVDIEVEENRRRERRRSEAKAAIELGNIVNGRGPMLDDDDDDEDPRMSTNMGPRMQQMMNPMMGMGGGMGGMNLSPQPGGQMNWGGWQSQMPTGQQPMLSPQQFMIPPPPPNADPNYFAAHQHAMMIAKQAYQYAVAQQAMAAAADEWERGSSFGGSRAPSSYMGGGGGFGMGSPGMGWGGQNMMFPGAAMSMYAGSAVGDTASDAGGWASKSVYGEAFGPSAGNRSGFFVQQQQASYARSDFGTSGQSSQDQQRRRQGQQQQQSPSGGGGGRGGQRPRTKSIPEAPESPTRPSFPGQRKAGPPSSWSARYQTALRD